ncbi:MAG: T9SS type A sorting domain-containing protein [Dysgonamonadaceae bacterium]|nr:T9SS type A sorting domain-containing protein [Dysgonamonadaceae bacterium]
MKRTALLCFIALSWLGMGVEAADYLQILVYGQSLSQGWEAPEAITTTPVEGNYMLGNSPLMRYNSGEAVLSPLVATKWDSGGEQPVAGCVNAFSTLYREQVDAHMKFIGMTGGEGGLTIERLSKECTNSGYYESTFIRILDNTLEALRNSNSTVVCPAIIYMQGESNCNNFSYYRDQGMTPGTHGTTDKEEYKGLLLQLKNNMQADIMSKYGQEEKPLFFIYQTSGKYIQMNEMNIAMAQYEFAGENEDVIMLNPHYAMPDYNGGHLSTNGYRWYGEIMGKILYDVLVEKKPYEPLQPQAFSIEDNAITIDYSVPSPPLVLDTWTTPLVSNYGFCVYKNGMYTNIVNKVEVKDDTKLVLTCSSRLTGKIEIIYAGKSTSGSGNLCDSYHFPSMYSYCDDSSASAKESYTSTDREGNKLYGKNYPLQNWSVGFYHKINIESGGRSLENIIFRKTDPNSLIQVYDVNGRFITESKENAPDLSILPNGFYIVRTEGDCFKIVKAD